MDEELRKVLFDAGAAGVQFNAPLGLARAHALVDTLGELGASSIVDLGCGRGELARMAGQQIEHARVTGVDTDVASIAHARQEATKAGRTDRVTFEVGDATSWTGTVDAAICIGASHVFGGSGEMFEHLASLVPSGLAVVGDGVWQTEPTEWCLTELGEMPRGTDELVELARSKGWIVQSSDLSSLDEWDKFEYGWTGGVRSLGTPEAVAFANERLAQYDNYRSILGFAWLVLSRTS